METIAKIRKLKEVISTIVLGKIDVSQISIDVELLDSLKNSPTTISMSRLEDLCVPLGINISEIADGLDVEVETKAIKIAKEEKKKKEESGFQIKIQALKDENEELIITLIEELRKEEDIYRDIDGEEVRYFVVISKEVIDEKQLKGLLEEETEFERRYEEWNGGKKTKHHILKKIGKNKFGFSQEANDDNGEFTYTYSLIERKKITSEKLAGLMKPSFLFRLDTPQLYSISDDLYRKLFFNPSRIGKQVISVIEGIGKDELDSFIVWLKKELKLV